MKIRRPGLIAAAMAVFSLLSVGGHGALGDHEYVVQFYTRCFAMYERHVRGDYISPDQAFGCDRSLGAVRDAYGAIGRLRPEYVESLKRWFKGNQTLIDMEICSLDVVRASENIHCATLLPKRFIDDDFFSDDEC
ncbi:hypothetical protein OROMI_013795 [Orobanche minor]